MTARRIPRSATCTVLLLCLGATSVAGREAAAQRGSVRGRVVVELGDVRVSELGPVVVSLEGGASTPASVASQAKPSAPTISAASADTAPSAGQSPRGWRPNRVA